jgi:hypothetical protein
MRNSLTDGEAVNVASIAGNVTDIAKTHEVELGLRQVGTGRVHAVLRQCRLQGQDTNGNADYLSNAIKYCHDFLEEGRSR